MTHNSSLSVYVCTWWGSKSENRGARKIILNHLGVVFFCFVLVLV